ncbi:DUF29 family protein [Nostoc sp. CHAB 5784]|uniref:DUF29 family protein n=1 Tax=Nostoc mirabile TaxID=2907820 RepID=UPI001E346622|nr:DUF29 family protein [Nostoc mirabile]MCC5663005.1 DUF29 family protein [Nostoc mirabile CHAB5784]
MTVEKMYTSHLYKTDFYTWTQEQVSLLKTQQWHQLSLTIQSVLAKTHLEAITKAILKEILK